LNLQEQEISIGSRFAQSAGQGLKKGLYAFFQLCTIMIPVYVGVELLKLTPILDFIGKSCEPLMKYFGLPGNIALAYVTGTFINIYAALAVIAGFHLNTREITILAIMLGISHSQLMEAAIVVKMKARPVVVTLSRVLFSLLIGFLLNLIFPA
jgi:hypothetical protein